MNIPTTFAVLLLLTAAMVVLRFFWWRLPERIQSWLLVCGAAFALLRVVFVLTQWSTTSVRVNNVLDWLSVAGLEVVLVRFSLMRPQWLTAPCALVLLTPLFGSSLLMPLAELFNPNPAKATAIGGNYLCEKTPWQSWGHGNTGYDLVIFYRPQYAPFLRRMVQRFAFNTVECDAAGSFAAANPADRTVRFHCPGNPGQEAIDRILPIQPKTKSQLK